MKSQTSKIFFIFILLGIALSSCNSEPPKAPNRAVALTQENVKKYNPEDAAVRLLNNKPSIGSADKVSSLQVPVLTITYLNATMVQILRCSSDLELETTTGGKLTALSTGEYTFEDLEQAKWIWKGAYGSGKCKLVGTNISRENFQDLAAKPGNFYYLLNPCVAQPLSTTGKEGCSNKIIQSEVLENYDNNLKEEFIAKSTELAEVEGQLTAHFSNLKVIAGNIVNELKSCEAEYAREESKGKVLDGVISIAATAVGAVVGAYVGGPMGAVQGGQLMLGIARGILGKKAPKALNCPKVEELKEQAQGVMDAIDPQVQQVIKVRTEMTKLESTYADLDDTISSQTGTK